MTDKNTVHENPAPYDVSEKTVHVQAARKPILTAFTPNLMDEETLRAIFVARQPLVKRIVQDIDDATTSHARRHTLLIGPRGIGKTHMVSMVYYTVKEKAALYAKIKVAWLREEEWSIFAYADLLVQIFRALANEYPSQRTELNGFADKLRRMPVAQGEAEGERELLKFLGDHPLLLIAENINDLFAGIRLEGQQSLRAFIQNHSKVVLLATSPALTDDLSEHDSPFYGFFNTTHLKELTRKQANELLSHIATQAGDTELTDYLKTEQADHRLRVIEALAGGHPRIWILFSACMSRKLLDELVPLFVKMLDDLTPYYQERMRSLPPQERRIVALLCEASGAVPVREIAESCRLKPNAAAAILGKLEEKAFLRIAPEPSVTSTGDRRITYYEMREPLMRLCLEVKDNRAEPLKLIVEFLRLWFREEEIHERLQSLPEHADLTRRYLLAALKRIDEVRSESSRLMNEGTEYWSKGDYENGLLKYNEALKISPEDAKAWYNRGVALVYLGRHEEAVSSFGKAVEINPEYAKAWHNRGAALGKLGRYEEELASYDKTVDINPDYADALYNRGVVLGTLGRHEEALSSYDKAVEINPEDAKAWFNRGVALIDLGRYEEALESFDKAIDIDSLDGDGWYSRAWCLIQLGRLEDAVPAIVPTLTNRREVNNPVPLASLFMEKLFEARFPDSARFALADGLVTAYRTGNALPDLANALTQSIESLFVENITMGLASDWLSVWTQATENVPEMEVATRLLRAAVDWKATRDRGALLRLASEERLVLQQILARATKNE